MKAEPSHCRCFRPDRLRETNHVRSCVQPSRFARLALSLVSVSLLSVSLLPVIGFASSAMAQAVDDPFAGVEEMIVTGSTTAALLTPTSTSAIAFDSSALRENKIEDVSDLAAFVPNLDITTANATNASFFIRGVGIQDFGANASSSVPLFQDGVPRNPSATQLVGLFDLKGLSVLKGPQGSGNYRNASAGVFNVETASPEPDFSGYATMSLSKIVSVDARDANRYNFELAQNAPILGDTISMRLSARYKREMPFWENGCANRVPFDQRVSGDTFCGEEPVNQDIGGFAVNDSPVNEFLPRYIGQVDDYGFRGQLRIQPPDLPLELFFRVEVGRLARDSTVGQHIGTATIRPPVPGRGVPRPPTFGGRDRAGYADQDIQATFDEIEAGIALANPSLRSREVTALAYGVLGKQLRKQPFDNHPYRGDFDSPGRLFLDTHSATTKALVDLESVDIEFNAGIIDYRLSERRDVDLSPNIAFPRAGNDQAWSFYGDLEVSGEDIAEIPLEWNTGFYTLIEQVESNSAQTVITSTLTTGYQQEIYSWGAFVKGRYELLEGLEIAAGVRYNWERKDFEIGLINSAFAGFSTSRNQRTWDAFTGDVELKYRFTEDIEIWAKYTKGFKAGHFNPSRSREARTPGDGFADPESIDSLEVGLKFAAWDNRFNGLANAFFYNYKNYQVFRLTTGPGGIFRAIQNAQRARVYGAEIDFTIMPLEGIAPEMIERLSINVKGGWLVTNFIEFTVLEQRTIGDGNFSVSIDYSGNPLISAAELQATLTISWPIDLGRLGTFTPTYDTTWTDDIPYGPNKGRGELAPVGDNRSRFSPYTVGNRAYQLHNVRLSWEPPGESGIQIGGFCRNVTDERYANFGVDLSQFSSQMFFFLADPRTCGADVRLSW